MKVSMLQDANTDIPDGPRVITWRKDQVREFLGYVALFVILSTIYEFMRHFVGPDSDRVPLRYARDVISFERDLGLFFEPHVQRAVDALPAASDVAAWLYAYEHLTGSILFLLWLWVMRPSRFPFVWRWFWIAHAIALLGFWLYPLAPPRLVPELGLADPAAAELARAPAASAFAHIRNEFAAMPSLHVGYPLLFAVVLWYALPRGRVRWLVWLWPLTMAAVVIATANHYWLDEVGGAVAVAVALGASLVLFRDLPRPWSVSSR